MKSIIEQMYDGDLFPTGTYEHSSMEYKRAMDKLVAAESELLVSYPQIKELFDRYQSAQDYFSHFEPA